MVCVAANGLTPRFEWPRFGLETDTPMQFDRSESIQQLKAAAEAAKKTGKTLVYMFLERPTKGTVEKIEKAGGQVVYWLDR